MDTKNDKTGKWNGWRRGLHKKGPDVEAGKTDEAGLSRAPENSELIFFFFLKVMANCG